MTKHYDLMILSADPKKKYEITKHYDLMILSADPKKKYEMTSLLKIIIG
jgi:BarA-like signal transduction histidine kinase